MSYQNKLFPYVALTPANSSFGNNWDKWFNDLQLHVTNKDSLKNNPTVLNPDMHLFGTARSTDGETCKPWQVKANGLTFTSTPTAYTSTEPSTGTGSKQFIKVDITGNFGGDFDFFQEIKNSLSLYQNQTVTMSGQFTNNGSAGIPMHFYIGIDTTNSGTDDVVQTSAQFNLRPGSRQVSTTFKIPKVTVDNQTNTVTLKAVFPAVSAAINFDVLYIKDEFSRAPTVLSVDHTLEKFKIDNAP